MISGTSQYFSLVHMTTIGYTRAEFSLMLKEIKALLRGKLVLTRPSRKVKSNKVYSGLWQKFHVFVSPSPLNLHGNIMWLVFCVHVKLRTLRRSLDCRSKYVSLSAYSLCIIVGKFNSSTKWAMLRWSLGFAAWDRCSVSPYLRKSTWW